MATDSEVSLTRKQRSGLSSIAQSRSLPAGYVFRAKLILMLAEGAFFNTIKRRLQTSAPTIIRWKQRFLESGLDGLDTRHGTLSLHAALDTKTGRVHGRTTARHTSRDFVAFLEEVVSLCSPRQQIHIILDNLSGPQNPTGSRLPATASAGAVSLHPYLSSWLKIWFAKIEREVIARGIFSSVPGLARKLRRYINAYSANARPIRWKYSDSSRHLRTNEFTATVH
jgi:hypothetical protein